MSRIGVVCSAVVWLVVSACSSNSGGQSTSDKANPCATPGANYLETFAALDGGTCGALATITIQVNADGTIALQQGLSCASVTVTGCTTLETDCTFSDQGTGWTQTLSLTFASDGSSATGTFSATSTAMGLGAMPCSGTYDVTAPRQ